MDRPLNQDIMRCFVLKPCWHKEPVFSLRSIRHCVKSLCTMLAINQLLIAHLNFPSEFYASLHIKSWRFPSVYSPLVTTDSFVDVWMVKKVLLPLLAGSFTWMAKCTGDLCNSFLLCRIPDQPAEGTSAKRTTYSLTLANTDVKVGRLQGSQDMRLLFCTAAQSARHVWWLYDVPSACVERFIQNHSG